MTPRAGKQSMERNSATLIVAALLTAPHRFTALIGWFGANRAKLFTAMAAYDTAGR